MMQLYISNLTVQVAPGDAMIIASDGLFDNLFDEEIAEIVNALVRVRMSAALSAWQTLCCCAPCCSAGRGC